MSSENGTGFLKGVFATLATLAALIAIYEFVIKNMMPSQPVVEPTPSTVVLVSTQVATETLPFPTRTSVTSSTVIEPTTTTSIPATVVSTKQRERFRVDARIPKNRTGISVATGDTLDIEYLDGQWTGEQGKQLLHTAIPSPKYRKFQICATKSNDVFRIGEGIDTGCGIFFDDPVPSHVYALNTKQGTGAALIGYIDSYPFISGCKPISLQMDTSGELYLGMNDCQECFWDNSGELYVRIKVTK